MEMKFLIPSLFMIFAVMPSSTNYGLNNYGFGSGGGSSSSSSYGLNGITGESSSTQSSSTNYQARSGNNNSQQADVPSAPTFTNPANYYDRLHFIVNPNSDAPSDTKYSIAISSNGFSTTNYIQADDTVGSTKVYQTYTNWGGSTGQYVIGLLQATTYQVKMTAIKGNYTETQYSTASSAATVQPSISFNIYTDTQSTPPYTVSLGSLLPSVVTTASNKIHVGLTTNANSGAYVYVSSQYAGLHSNSANNTISSATANLSTSNTGYGAQGVTATQSSGGPFTLSSPYNGTGQSVGVLNTLLTPIYNSTSAVTSAAGTFQIMARASPSTPEAGDYSDNLSLTAAGNF
jgi:hypothetical protein